MDEPFVPDTPPEQEFFDVGVQVTPYDLNHFVGSPVQHALSRELKTPVLVEHRDGAPYLMVHLHKTFYAEVPETLHPTHSVEVTVHFVEA